MAGQRTGQDVLKDVQENVEGEKPEAVDTSSQEMKESNPAFLKYLQFKVYFFHQNEDIPTLNLSRSRSTAKSEPVHLKSGLCLLFPQVY